LNNNVSLFFAAGLASGQKSIGPNTIYRQNQSDKISDFLSWQRPLEELNEPLLKVDSKTSIKSAALKMTGEASDGLIVT